MKYTLLLIGSLLVAVTVTASCASAAKLVAPKPEPWEQILSGPFERKEGPGRRASFKLEEVRKGMCLCIAPEAPGTEFAMWPKNSTEPIFDSRFTNLKQQDGAPQWCGTLERSEKYAITVWKGTFKPVIYNEVGDPTVSVRVTEKRCN